MKKLVIVFTGTVASTLSDKILEAFKEYDITTVVSDKSKFFVSEETTVCSYEELQEWTGGHYQKNQPIPHIDLAKDNNALLIIASADFIAKMANGICNDLPSSLYRAWHREFPVIVCPAMNSHMFEHPVTKTHLAVLKSWDVIVVPPVEKQLACGDFGIGALADISDIKKVVDGCYTNTFPLKRYKGIPVSGHPGSFLANRKHSPHTGVDLYTQEFEPFYAMNNGRVISTEDFTGTFDGSDWWEDTRCILIEHWFGVVCYGEVSEWTHLEPGMIVKKGQDLGRVKRVLKKGKERPDIEGHSLSMLHVELYPKGTKKASTTYNDSKDILLDPTPFLIEAEVNPDLLKGGC